jgi:hypothetical protein
VPLINEALRDLFHVSSELHCDVLVRWVPRETLSEADALSREPDATDWGIQPDLFAQICKRFDVKPSVDLFGSDSHHTATGFVSKVYVPGCIAVNAFRQEWDALAQGGVAWVFPPTRAVSQALSQIERQHIDALIVMPASPASNEFIQLHRMHAKIRGPFTIPRIVDSIRPSMRVPANTLNPAFLGLGVYRISWS